MKIMFVAFYKPLIKILILSSLFGAVYFAHAQVSWTGTPANIYGYAWSSNIGWISFNCDQTLVGGGNTCGSSNYGVEITNINGNLDGYAWSSNIGWIQFGEGVGGLDLTGCPSGTCQSRVVLEGTQYKLSGWARACSAIETANCDDGEGLHLDGGGWDGWISLNCSNSDCTNSYGVRVGTGNMTNYAWGDEVIGWIDFDAVEFEEPCSPPTLTCSPDDLGYTIIDQWCIESTVNACDPGYMCLADEDGCTLVDITDYNLTANKNLVRIGGTVTLDWYVNPSEADSCTVTGNNGESWIGLTDEDTGGTVTTSGLTRQSNIFTLECVVAGGGPNVEVTSVTINLLPQIIET